jgi:DNA polymerase-3 subunit alpha
MTTNIKDLIGKNILIYDLETTGLPTKKINYETGINQYYDPSDLEKYDNCRIVSIAYTFIKNFNLVSLKNSIIKTYIRKPHKFIISEENSKFHGITNKYAIKNGIKFKNIISQGFNNDLANCDYIVGHNIIFDIFVLLSEFYRSKFNVNFQNLKFHLDENKYLCTGELGREICKLPTKIKNYTYKMPQLKELYEKVCNNNDLQFHDAKNDVLAVIRILTNILNKN